MKVVLHSKKSLLTAVLLGLCVAGTAFAATEHWEDASLAPSAVTATPVSEATDWSEWKAHWEELKGDFSQVSLAPGADEASLNLAWYERDGVAPQVRLAKSADMQEARTFTGTAETGMVVDGVQYYGAKVTLTGLEAKTTYWYQVKKEGQWQEPRSFTTGDPEDFTFMYVGDPQIGASKGQVPAEGSEAQTSALAARNDAYNWNKTLNEALSQHPEINFLVSPGDQINEPAESQAPEKILQQEHEYAGFLSAKALRGLPLASSIGNHDSMTAAYKYHFNTPNSFTEEENPTAAGHGYFYSYGPALFIHINANNYNAADHRALIEKAIQANPTAKWRIVVMHQDIYGSGLDHSDSDGIILRTQLTPIFDANKIDVVLQGHDHTYARTYQLTSDGKAHDSFDEYKAPGQSGQAHKILSTALKDSEKKAAFTSQNMCYTIADMRQGELVNPKGVFYLSSNSATGSKYYELMPQQQDYVAARSQTWRPTYSVIRVTRERFSVLTYDAATGTPIDEMYSIVKR